MKIERELFLRTPEGKPPFIAVNYTEGLSMAQLENSNIFSLQYVRVHLRPYHANMRIDVYPEASDTFCTYNVSYDWTEFFTWAILIKGMKDFNFGHVQTHIGKGIRMSRSEGKSLYVPIRGLSVLGSGGTILSLSQ
jgi:hypothetical protein